MPLLTEDIPKDYRRGLEFESAQTELSDSLNNLRIFPARLAHSRQIALHVRHEHRHSELAETLGDHSQRDRFSGPRRSGDHPMPVRHLRQQVEFFAVLRYQYWICHGLFFLFLCFPFRHFSQVSNEMAGRSKSIIYLVETID